ncbi:hypothetical protein ZEAMMB73_Zm00001d017389, partial [Zea mays]
MQFFGGSLSTSIAQEATPTSGSSPVPIVATHGGCTAPARVHDLGHQPTASPVFGASDIVATAEVCTIFTDLSADVKERELHNLLCWLLGFEVSYWMRTVPELREVIRRSMPEVEKTRVINREEVRITDYLSEFLCFIVCLY